MLRLRRGGGPRRPGWDIAGYDKAGVPTIKSGYQRDESEQVRYMQEVNQVFVEEGLGWRPRLAFQAMAALHAGH